MSRPDKENPSDRIDRTARELRKHRPRPSEALVSRVERLAEREAEQGSRPARLQVSRRRLVFAFALVLAVAAVGGVIAGELGRSSKQVAAQTTRQNGVVFGIPRVTSTTETSSSYGAFKTAGGTVPSSDDQSAEQYLEAVPATAGTTHQARQSAAAPATVAPITTGNRLAELRATLLLKVENRDQLSERTAQAMKIARSLSGYVVSALVHAPSRGVATSYLVLKIPAKRSQEALIRISALGKILSQQVSLEDVKATVTAEGKSIQALKREIASLEQTLSDQSLTPQARSQLQIQLAKDRARLSSMRTQRTKDILRGRLATITLTFTTGDLSKPAAPTSRVHKAINRAWDGLSSEISWAAQAIIVASPFLVLAGLLVAAYRIRRRREERRLLEK